MNIVEAYIKYNKCLIILVSGLSGSKKTILAGEIERDFKLKKIDIENFCIDSKDNKRTVKITDNITVTDWDNIDSYDWDKINAEVDKYKNTGVVVCGPYFPTFKLKFNPDFHIHVKIAKPLLIEARINFIKENREKCKELLPLLENSGITLLIDKLTYPYYVKYLEQSKVDKFINSKDLNSDQIYDEASNFLFFKINEFLKNYKLVSEKKTNPDLIKNLYTSSISSISSTSSLSNDERNKKNNKKDSSSSFSSTPDSSDTIFLGTEYDEYDELRYIK